MPKIVLPEILRKLEEHGFQVDRRKKIACLGDDCIKFDAAIELWQQFGDKAIHELFCLWVYEKFGLKAIEAPDEPC